MTKVKAKIIVIDDNIKVQDLTKAFLKEKGIATKSFFDARSAIEELLSDTKYKNIILSDFCFKDMSKEDFILVLKKHFLGDLPFINISSNSLSDACVIIERTENDKKIKKAISFPEIYKEIEDVLSKEYRQYVKVIKNIDKDVNLIGSSKAFLKAVDLALKVAPSTSTILLVGESGTGKEVFANFIHSKSKRKGLFVAINCSAIPESLLEAELFGFAKGSFTGAINKKIGLFEQAEDGTLFLDEIGDLSLSLQAKLLRAIQEKKIKRVGENVDIPINCRIISATHKNLAEEVTAERFREDLYFRINVIFLKIPPLRERKEDILELAEVFLRSFSLKNNLDGLYFSESSKKWLVENSWRGNVRELENTIERAVVLSSKKQILLEDFILSPEERLESRAPLANGSANGSNAYPKHRFCVGYEDALPSLESVKNSYIRYAIKANNGARDKTALAIGIDRKTLYRRED